MDGYVINFSVNGFQQPPVDLLNNPNETRGCFITNLHPGSSVSALVLAYADRELYHERKYVGAASKRVQITLASAEVEEEEEDEEEEEEEREEAGWFDLA